MSTKLSLRRCWVREKIEVAATSRDGLVQDRKQLRLERFAPMILLVKSVELDTEVMQNELLREDPQEKLSCAVGINEKLNYSSTFTRNKPHSLKRSQKTWFPIRFSRAKRLVTLLPWMRKKQIEAFHKVKNV